jgi:hypothetical protein
VRGLGTEGCPRCSTLTLFMPAGGGGRHSNSASLVDILRRVSKVSTLVSSTYCLVYHR